MAAIETKNVRGLKVFKRTSATLKALRNLAGTPEIHGNKIWFSSYFVMDYLKSKPPARQSKIMEIGCGWGLLSIFCAKHFNAEVTAVDADKNVFPFLQLHATENDVDIRIKLSRYESLSRNTLAKQDMIIGADICFWDELVDPLYNVIANAVEESVERIVIADPGRPPFLELAKRCGKSFQATLRETSMTRPYEKEGYLLVIQN